jgi:hypothetical protein
MIGLLSTLRSEGGGATADDKGAEARELAGENGSPLVRLRRRATAAME